MADIALSSEERSQLTEQLQLYFQEELDLELGRFPAEFLLDFIIERMGPSFYNRGLEDARVLMMQRVEALGEDIYALEKPVKL
jgi:uncharacterized protein (DUF2164 family)